MAYWYPQVWSRFQALKDEVRDKFPSRCDWGCGWKQKMPGKRADEAMICVECGTRDMFEEQPPHA